MKSLAPRSSADPTPSKSTGAPSASNSWMGSASNPRDDDPDALVACFVRARRTRSTSCGLTPVGSKVLSRRLARRRPRARYARKSSRSPRARRRECCQRSGARMPRRRHGLAFIGGAISPCGAVPIPRPPTMTPARRSRRRSLRPRGRAQPSPPPRRARGWRLPRQRRRGVRPSSGRPASSRMGDGLRPRAPLREREVGVGVAAVAEALDRELKTLGSRRLQTLVAPMADSRSRLRGTTGR
jgi:hypothetical protein